MTMRAFQCFKLPARTLIAVHPPGGGGPGQFRTPRWLGLAVRVAAALAVLQLGHHGWLILRGGAYDRELARERESLRNQGAEHAREAERLANQIEGIEVQLRRLAVLAGAEPVERQLEGLGGASSAATGFDYVSARIDELSSRLARLDEQGVALERVLRERSLLMASTPTIWPVRGYVSSGYGRRPDPFTGAIEWHHGLDVSTNVGVAVRATADGTVLETGSSPTFGKHVVVSHGFGVVTRYAHLSRIDVRSGQRLRRRQVLGAVGNTGRSRAPHLHYEIWVDGRARNPLDFIVDYALAPRPAPTPG